VLPHVLAGAGRLMLHAGAAVVAGSGVAFLGSSGQGKSTLISYLCRRGALLLADDGLLVTAGPEGFQCIPAYPGVRLWPEAVESLFQADAVTSAMSPAWDKRRLSAGENGLAFAEAPAPLRKIYLLSSDASADALVGAVDIVPLSPTAAFKPLFDGSYRLDLRDSQKIKGEFDLIARILTTVPAAALCFSRDYGLLSSVRDAILSDLSSLSSTICTRS
jgi:hypothetical protein